MYEQPTNQHDRDLHPGNGKQSMPAAVTLTDQLTSVCLVFFNTPDPNNFPMYPVPKVSKHM